MPAPDLAVRAKAVEGALDNFFHLPREGGDPDLFARTVINALDPRLRGEDGKGGPLCQAKALK